MPLVDLKRVRYQYEDSSSYALDEIDLTIEPGEYVLLAGASGSGKSTLCRLFNGLIPHFHGGRLNGRVIVDGLDTQTHRVVDLFAHVGMVFQNPAAQLFNSTVEREIAFGLESLGLAPDEIARRIRWALETTGLAALYDRPPNTLSGGEQQTVALAAILALRPRLLVLDEPFTNLDPQAIERIRAILQTVHGRGTTVLVAEHRLHASLQDATRLVILHNGRIVSDGPPREVLQEDLSPFRLNTPFVVRLAKKAGVYPVPLSVDEAIAAGLGTDVMLGSPVAVLPTVTSSGSPAVVELRDLTFVRDGRPVLQNINLAVHAGECIAFVGKNGSGKTTLLKHLNGLYRPTSGMVTVLGKDTRRERVGDLAKRVGLVFQNPNDQLFKANVRDEIEAGPRALRALDRPWIDHLISEFGLAHLLDRSPFNLSEGEKKRVAFSAALATHPSIFVLDEPTTGQDGSFRQALSRLLSNLRKQSFTVILATHDLEFAECVAPRWIALSAGEIVAHGSPDEVMRNTSAVERAALRPTARFLLRQSTRNHPAPLTTSLPAKRSQVQ